MNPLLKQIKTYQKDGIGSNTAKEIKQQPQSWKETWKKVCEEEEALASFCDTVFSYDNVNVVLTGAGSSAFVGDAAAATWQKCFNTSAQAIPTTDLVTHFKDKVITQDPLLLISFARSGNSPESTAAIEIANKCCSKVYHLIITCNPNGYLAAMENEDTYVFLLPPGAEDKGLAMTNSFTSMLLAVMAIPKMLTGNRDEIGGMIETMCGYAKKIVTDFIAQLYEISIIDFNRIVFLGSGPNWGIAKESHLKVQELTNVKVVGKYDSFLGFRHGPKAVINKDTLLVYLLSNKGNVLPYERDLIEQINRHDIGLTTLAIAETDSNSLDTDYVLTLSESSLLDDDLWAIVCTLPAQIIGFFKSRFYHYNPDNPSPDGTIARVVEGVTIYPALTSHEK